ncbi:PAS domain-containing sensor histidine kinase [Pseudoruegeria sp. SK021]|uniref:PAS domain-containing sensor histidine kinase n=1 Tax=Pseudoruegeria sp. SK021 TaxID=1933035 RepID=UPI001F0A9B98|nr:PAS domain-containing sensor histidine kinase [Pseudoruegeria sp. SK021]
MSGDRQNGQLGEFRIIRSHRPDSQSEPVPELAKKYSLTWKVTPDLLGILNDSGLFENTNPAWFTTLGFLPDEVESRSFLSFVHPDDLPATEAAFEAVQRGTPVLKFENRYRHKNGSYRWLSWNTVPEGGRYYCSARDVTEHKEAVNALLVTERDAHLREQFIAVLGHDLRNPLAAIASAIRIIRREAQTETTLHMLSMTQGAVDRMTALIEDVMDLARSRLGAGLSIDRGVVLPLMPALRQVIAEIQLAQPDAKIEAVLDFADPVNCDPARLAQLLSNLLSNAVSHGAATRPIRMTAADEDGQFTLTVANQGPAIPEKALEMLFQPFFRANAGANQDGLGLGLFIASEIARAHGGTLTATSEQDWTVFRFQMPRT